MFVTAQDFNDVPYSIPDASVVQPDGTITANTKFNNFILRLEKALLIEILGGNFYQLLVDAINALPAAWVQTVSPDGYAINALVLSSDEHVYKSLVADNGALLTDQASWELQVDSVWLLLKNGDTYTFNNNAYFWEGLKQVLIPGIYSAWLKATYDNHSSYGIVVAKVENAGVASPSTRITDSYNDMIERAGNFFNQKNSLYGYAYQKNVLDNRFVNVYTNFSSFSEYLNQTFSLLEPINIFDL